MSSLLNNLIAPVKPQSASVTVEDSIYDNSAVAKEVTCCLPCIGGEAANLIAKAVMGIFNDQANPSGKEAQPLSPFMFTPNSLGATTSPSAVIEFLKSEGAHIPHGGRELNPSLNSLYWISGIPVGTLSSLNSGKMKMDANKLELWRKALVTIGVSNRNDWLTSFDNPENYLDSLLEDYKSMASALPLERIREWATKHTNILENDISAKLGSVTMTVANYLTSIIGIWREQYTSNVLDNLVGCYDFMSVLKMYTGRKSTKRAFNKLIPTIHRGMPQFNRRVKYPVKLTTEYSNRYTGVGHETGLTAEILLAYCFYLGMNPMSLLRWLATAELRNPGSHISEGITFDINDLVGWRGVVSPWEFNRFVVLISSLGLVSDQEKWALCVYDASNIYRNIPTKADIDRTLEDKAMTFDSTLTHFFYGNNDMPTPCTTIGEVPYAKLSGDLQITTMVEPQAYQNIFFLYALGDEQLASKCDGMEVDEINTSVHKKLKNLYRSMFRPEDMVSGERTYSNLSQLDHSRMVVAASIYSGVIKHHQLEVNTSSL